MQPHSEARLLLAKFTHMSDLASGEISTPLEMWYSTAEGYFVYRGTAEYKNILSNLRSVDNHLQHRTASGPKKLRPTPPPQIHQVCQVVDVVNFAVQKYSTAGFSIFRCMYYNLSPYKFQIPDDNDSSVIVIKPKIFLSLHAGVAFLRSTYRGRG
jgi:hypothetical protein